MRLFSSLEEAILEIRRDLSKAPVVQSSRVQNQKEPHLAREAQNYSYTMTPDSLPGSQGLAALASTYFPSDFDEIDYAAWLEWQRGERIHEAGLRFSVFDPADRVHPLLSKLREGDHWAYTYAERLHGTVEHAATALLMNWDSRRVFIPIFQPIDFLRSHAMTRIPCSIGYHLMIRDIPGEGRALHMTYLSRSCDFEKFWLSDLWLAAQFQDAVWNELTNRWSGEGPQIEMPRFGSITHHIISFHRFVQNREEIF